MRSGHVHLIGTNQRAICVFSLSQSKICWWRQCFFFFLRWGRRPHWNHDSLRRVLHFDPLCGSSNAFHYLNKSCQRMRHTHWCWSARLIKAGASAIHFFHVWSHLSSCSLLGSTNLTEASSRSCTYGIVWWTLSLFIAEFTSCGQSSGGGRMQRR